MEQPASPAPGLIGSLAGVFRNTARLILSRIELAALELSEVRDHLVRLSVVFALALVAGWFAVAFTTATVVYLCLLYTSPSPRDQRGSRMPSSA